MQLSKRINLKLFIPLSVLSTAIFLFFCKNQTEVLTTLGIYVATLANLYLLLYVVSQFILNPDLGKGEKISKTKLVLAFIGKMAILLGALTLGVQFIGNKIIIAIFNYIAQIFVLGITLNRGSSDVEKR